MSLFRKQLSVSNKKNFSKYPNPAIQFDDKENPQQRKHFSRKK